MKIVNYLLKNKLDIIFKEKNDLSICFEKSKKDFNDHKIICKGKNPNNDFDRNDFSSIQKRIDILDSTLMKYAFDMSKFSSLFSKGKTQRKHTSTHIQHTSHVHHTSHIHQHNHAFIYGKVYTCTHYSRNGHLA